MKKQFAFILFFVLVYTSSAFAQQPRPEYPRPQFERKEWINLNGEWSYQFDFVGEGVEKRLYDSKGFEGKITVPFAHRCRTGAERHLFLRSFLQIRHEAHT